MASGGQKPGRRSGPRRMGSTSGGARPAGSGRTGGQSRSAGTPRSGGTTRSGGTSRGSSTPKKPASSARTGRGGSVTRDGSTARAAASTDRSKARGTSKDRADSGRRSPLRGSNVRTAQGRSEKTRATRPNYGVRRTLALLLVLAAVLALVWLVLFVIGWFSDMLRDDPETEAAPDPEASELFTGQPGTCTEEDVSWTLDTTAGSAGANVGFDWSITNHGELPCTIDAAPTNLVFSVTSGEDQIWSSAHCGAPEPFLLLLGPDDSTERRQVWDGTRSQEGCEPVAATVQPGTYQVTMTLNGVELAGGSETFELSATAVGAKPGEEESGTEPTDGEDTPAEGDAPAEDEEAPAEDEEAPADGEEAPAGGGDAPAQDG